MAQNTAMGYIVIHEIDLRWVDGVVGLRLIS